VPTFPHDPRPAPLDDVPEHIRQQAAELDRLLGQTPRYGFRSTPPAQSALSQQRPRAWSRG
jgi:hypothetical protein